MVDDIKPNLEGKSRPLCTTAPIKGRQWDQVVIMHAWTRKLGAVHIASGVP
jgi:hypothetical protein